VGGGAMGAEFDGRYVSPITGGGSWEDWDLVGGGKFPGWPATGSCLG